MHIREEEWSLTPSGAVAVWVTEDSLAASVKMATSESGRDDARLQAKHSGGRGREAEADV